MIKVLAAGLLTSIQDLGRAGYSNIGVPISGAMDQYSAKLSNVVLGNKVSDAVLEVTFGGCKLLFMENSYICISGADFSAKINNQQIALNKALEIKKGDILSFENQHFGCRTYISVLGGLKTEKVLNSRSFFKGITHQERIKKGDYIPFNSSNKHVNSTFSSIKFKKARFDTKTITCYKGPEYEFLQNEQKELLEQTLFTISNANNRMGYQLNEKIPNTLKSMLTSAVFPGTVQLTPSGKIIILMRDCQVTGGYPRILVLPEDEINKLSQKTTNDSFYIKIIDFKK